MIDERDVRDALQAEEVPPSFDEWPHFDRSLKRARRRLRLVSAVTVLIIGSGATVLGLSLLHRTRSELVGPVSNNVADWPVYVDAMREFQMAYPPDWTDGGGPDSGQYRNLFPLSRMLLPFQTTGSPPLRYDTDLPKEIEANVGGAASPGTGSCDRYRAAQPSFFYNGNNPCQGPHLPRFDEKKRAGVRITESDQTFAGRPAHVYDMRYPEKPAVVPDNIIEFGQWCAGCKEVYYVVDWFDGWTIAIDLTSPDASTYERYAGSVQTMLESMTRFDGPPQQPKRDPNARTTASHIPDDDYTRALQSYLSARIDRTDPSQWAGAKPERGVQFGDGGFSGYEIRSRAMLQPKRALFLVFFSFTTQWGPGDQLVLAQVAPGSDVNGVPRSAVVDVFAVQRVSAPSGLNHSRPAPRPSVSPS